MVRVIVVGVLAISLGFAGCLRLMGALEKHHRRTEARRREIQRQREDFWRQV